ncbi:hypothetical protein H2248_008460 [Termitomyces sp. 'cryptogamus']|nr:hypothetical protein H2248_008460 [Termitomyces sp. 'cryptogamus']
MYMFFLYYSGIGTSQHSGSLLKARLIAIMIQDKYRSSSYVYSSERVLSRAASGLSMADALTPDTDSVYFDAPTQQQPSTMFSEQSSNRGLSASAPTKRPNGGVPPPDVTEKDSPVHRSNSSTSWLPAVDFPPEDTQPVHFAQAGQDLRAGNANLQVGNPPHRAIGARSPSPPRRGSHMRSPSPPAHRALDIRSPSPAQGTSAQGASDIRRSASRRSMFTSGSTGHPIEGSTFIGGAATTGPHSTALPDQELTTRAAAADANLSRKDRSRIAKSEAEDGKQLSKIIKDEGRAEKQALGLAIRCSRFVFPVLHLLTFD